MSLKKSVGVFLVFAAACVVFVWWFLVRSGSHSGVGHGMKLAETAQITDVGTQTWINSQGGDYKVAALFAREAEGELGVGKTSKMLIYVPGGYSDIRYDVTRRFGKQHITFKVMPPTENQNFKFLMLEQENIEDISFVDASGSQLTSRITEKESFYVFGWYHAYYRENPLDTAYNDFADELSAEYRFKERFGEYEAVLDGKDVIVSFKNSLTEENNDRVNCFAYMLLATWEIDSLSWTYTESNGRIVRNSVDRGMLDGRFEHGYTRTWEEFALLCPREADRLGGLPK